MNVKIYIDNTLIDYAENTNLPLVLKIAYRDFKKIAETEAIDLENASSSLVIPATKTNKAIFEGNEHTFFDIDVLRNGQNFFKGRCRLISKSYERTTLTAYNLELYLGNADIFERLEGVSIRDLDMGQIAYSDSNVLTSWNYETSDDQKIIYAPVVYGKLNSGTADHFELEDMRPAVYYETILKGIEDYLKITIESNLRDSDIWKRSVHLFGVGDLWENFSSDITQNLTADGTVTTLTYTQSSSDTIVYKVEVNVPSGNNSTNDLYELEIKSDTGYNERILYDANNGINSVSAEIQLNNVGEKIQLIGHKGTGNSQTTLPANTQFLIKSTTKVVEGSSVRISSCLHDIPVKDWLKEMFLQFNLVSFFNPVTKVLRLDSMFDFESDGTIHEGFYRTDNVIDVQVNREKSSKSFQPFFDKITMTYQQNNETEEYVNQYIEHTTHPVNCCDISINEGDNAKIYTSIYSNVFNGLVDLITNHELLLLFDGDVKLQEKSIADMITDDELNPTFITEPKNAIVTGEPFSAYYNGTNYSSMPLLRQNNLRRYKDYTLTFSDCDSRAYTLTQINKGLVSTFYKKYFSILSRLELLKIEIVVDNIFDINTYRNAYKIDGELYFLIELKKVQHNTKLCEGIFVKHDYIRNTDDFYSHENPSSALQILNII